MNRAEIVAAVIEQVKEVTGRSSVGETDRFTQDLGVDSLSYARILLACEQGIKLPLNLHGIVWSQVDTVGKMADLFSQGA